MFHSGDFHFFGLEIMFHHCYGVGFQRDCFLKLLRLVFLLVLLYIPSPVVTVACRCGRREAFVHLLEIWHFAEKSLEVEAGIGIPGGLILNCVSKIDIIHCGTPVPFVDSVIRNICSEIIKYRNTVERRTIRGGEGLIVIPGCTEALYGIPNRVSPLLVLVGEQFLVHGTDCLLYAGCGV